MTWGRGGDYVRRPFTKSLLRECCHCRLSRHRRTKASCLDARNVPGSSQVEDSFRSASGDVSSPRQKTASRTRRMHLFNNIILLIRNLLIRN